MWQYSKIRPTKERTYLEGKEKEVTEKIGHVTRLYLSFSRVHTKSRPRHCQKGDLVHCLCSLPLTAVASIGGGGGTQVQRGPAPALLVSFLRPPHVRDFVKEGYFFVPRYEVWGGGGGGVKIPLQSTK